MTLTPQPSPSPNIFTTEKPSAEVREPRTISIDRCEEESRISHPVGSACEIFPPVGQMENSLDMKERQEKDNQKHTSLHPMHHVYACVLPQIHLSSTENPYPNERLGDQPYMIVQL
mmetsp:Transcript_9107/g.14937  ORF Transcript_9107/g.14937 Transcript_9107/m.14937 type:complete len:116 (-) Transcript_9107:1607-1954(-)